MSAEKSGQNMEYSARSRRAPITLCKFRLLPDVSEKHAVWEVRQLRSDIGIILWAADGSLLMWLAPEIQSTGWLT